MLTAAHHEASSPYRCNSRDEGGKPGRCPSRRLSYETSRLRQRVSETTTSRPSAVIPRVQTRTALLDKAPPSRKTRSSTLGGETNVRPRGADARREKETRARLGANIDGSCG